MKGRVLERLIEDIEGSVDWSAVDVERADLIYKEARMVQKGIRESIETVNKKAFSLLALNLTLMISILSFLFIQYQTTDGSLMIYGLILCAFLFLSLLAFGFVLYPRNLPFMALEPASYFAEDYYKGSLLEVLQGNILSCMKDIDNSLILLRNRSQALKIGLLILGLAPIVVFIVVYCFS